MSEDNIIIHKSGGKFFIEFYEEDQPEHEGPFVKEVSSLEEALVFVEQRLSDS